VTDNKTSRVRINLTGKTKPDTTPTPPPTTSRVRINPRSK
jgi:hypothetical protein